MTLSISPLTLCNIALCLILTMSCGSVQQEDEALPMTNKVDEIPELKKVTSEKFNGQGEQVAKDAGEKDEKSSEKEAKPELPKSIAILPFFNKTSELEASQTLRSTLYGHLASTNYRFPHIKDIDNRLAILSEEQKLNSDNANLLGNLLDVDGLLFGEVLNYDKFYVGIYAQITFKVKVTLVNLQGEVIWTDEFEEVSREGGVSVNALGLLYNIAVTAWHLNDENLLAVADKLGRQIANHFPQPVSFQGVNYSFIETVLHDGINKVLKYGDILQVGIKGEANKIASVTIENIPQVFPLIEQQPGIYTATISVDHSWNAADLMLTGILRDSSGMTSKYISSVGLLNFDNEAPQAVVLLQDKLTPERISLEWQKSEPNLLYKVVQIVGQTRIPLFETYQSEFVWEHLLQEFESLELSIIAIDKAGNKSVETTVKKMVYPLASMYQAEVIKSATLTATLNGQFILGKDQGPYIIDKKVILNAGAGLYIEPGTEIQFTNAGNLTIQGNLFTFPGPTIQLKPISNEITSPTFISLDSNQHVELNNVAIENAGIGIEILRGRPVIIDCAITNSHYSAITVAHMAQVRIKKCILSGSNTSGLIVTDRARVNIIDSQFSNNFPFHIQSSSIYEVEASANSWQPEASPISILGKVRY